MKAEKHSIKTIGDISKLITTENYKELLCDIVELFYIVLETKRVIKEDIGEYPHYSVMDEITWINDGKQGVISVTVNGKKKKVKPLKDR